MQKPIDWRPGIVRATRALTPDITWIEIAPEGDYVVPAPGAHLKVAVTIGGRPDMRSYSIVAPCPDGGYAIAVKRLEATRGGSAYMATLAPGARLMVAGPDNHFALSHGRPDYLLIAGGIGVTPIFAHAMALARTGAKFRVLYGVRSRADLALADELGAALGDRLSLFMGDEGGRIDLTAAFAELAPGGEAYVCGPIPMLEAAKRAWRDAGRPRELLRFETFGASGAWPTAPFRMKIPRLDKDVFVPAGKSMLDALEDAGVAMIFDCRKGECGLCALPILEVDGVVDHRDVFFSEEEKAENAKICTCVSRVYGKSITIDTADR
jgi:vanillate O-demethylase ferredoxin subunit